MNQLPSLYKFDSNGTPRKWRIFINPINPEQYCTVSGVVDGEEVQTGYTTAEAKNVGRANATTPEQQATLEVKAAWDKKIKQGYAENIQDSGVSFLKPMLAKKYDPKKLGDGEIFVQPKLDGIRCTISADGMFTRTGEKIISCPHIWAAVQIVFDVWPDIILDGELYNHELKDDFNKITSIVRRTKPKPGDEETAREFIQYHIYDCHIPGDGALFSTRIDLVEKVIKATGYGEGPIREVLTSSLGEGGSVDSYYNRAVGQGYEGLMVRRNGEYGENKRSWDLMKYKSFQDEEFEIVRILEGRGNWSGYAKVATCKMPDGRLFGATLKGTQAYCKDVLANADDYVGKQATVEFFEYTPDGIPRFPVAAKLHLKEKA